MLIKIEWQGTTTFLPLTNYTNKFQSAANLSNVSNNITYIKLSTFDRLNRVRVFLISVFCMVSCELFLLPLY